MRTTLLNRVAIVCGGSGSIGSVIAKRLADSGAKVAVQYRNHYEKADQVVHEIIQSGGIAQSFKADVTDEESTKTLFQQVCKQLGDLSVLVNTVHGAADPKNVFEMEWRDWTVHLDALKAHFLLCKGILPYMREKRYGRIVFISGGLSRRFFKGCSAYTTIKAGLNGFCKTLALEEGENGITVNIVAPGRVVSNEAGDSLDPALEELQKQRVSAPPVGRDATAEDIADAVLYFASQEARCITGQTLFVAGGEIMP